jgi:hypothetical protein
MLQSYRTVGIFKKRKKERKKERMKEEEERKKERKMVCA